MDSLYFLHSTSEFAVGDLFVVVVFLQHVCSELNWSCNLDSFDGEESCEMADAAAVTESMDVTDDLSQKELEEMLKEYIIIMEV